ncbi:hypothetical protein D3C86_1917440 [compost metagenome]
MELSDGVNHFSRRNQETIHLSLELPRVNHIVHTKDNPVEMFRYPSFLQHAVEVVFVLVRQLGFNRYKLC